MEIIEKKLEAMGIKLPDIKNFKPVGLYEPAVIADTLIFTSGVGPDVEGMEKFIGKVGKEITLDQGRKAAMQCAINLIANLKYVLGSLDRIERIVQLIGYINSASGFNLQPKVLNGASELFINLWGEKGRHARAALSANELWQDIPVECCLVAQIKK